MHGVVVEVVVLPAALAQYRLVEGVVFELDVLAFALFFGRLGDVAAGVQSALEELHANASKHENEQHGDKDDILDCADCDKDALHDVFESFCPVDRSQRTQDTQHSENFEHGNVGGRRVAENREQRHANHEQVEQVKPGAHVRAFVKNSAVGDHL